MKQINITLLKIFYIIFFNTQVGDIKIKQKNYFGHETIYVIDYTDFDGVDIEPEIPYKNKQIIRPNIVLYKWYGNYKIPIICFEFNHSHPVGKIKQKKINWLRDNRFPYLLVFEINCEQVNDLIRKVVFKQKYGHNNECSLYIENEL